MTTITESMIRRGMRELEDWACWNPQARPKEDVTRQAVICILTAALGHEPKEKQTMQEESEVNAVPLSIADGVLRIGPMNHGWLFDRRSAPELIAFIQQWLDHDPEGELRTRVNALRGVVVGGDCLITTPDIIEAVREHDRKHGRPE